MPVVSTNLAANAAHRLLNINADTQSISVSKIASGSRITKASDDAAGLAISIGFRSDIATLRQAATNASHAIAILQMADGVAGNIADILIRMKSLATQAVSSAVTDTERSYINSEYTSLLTEITALSHNTCYLGQRLTCAVSNWGPVIVGTKATDTILLSPPDAYLCEFGLDISATTIATLSDAQTTLSRLDHALGDTAEGRAALGAQMSQFEARSNAIVASIECLSAASSAIEDVDVAAERAHLSSAEVKLQAGVAALASANSMPHALLKLLQ